MIRYFHLNNLIIIYSVSIIDVTDSSLTCISFIIYVAAFLTDEFFKRILFLSK